MKKESGRYLSVEVNTFCLHFVPILEDELFHLQADLPMIQIDTHNNYELKAELQKKYFWALHKLWTT